MDHFLRGHAAGQAEKEHEQQLEQNKLHMLVLKHQIDGLKIEDQIRARELAKQNLDFLHGQPDADIPSDAVTTQQPNLPATNLAGMMTGLIRDRQTQGMTPGAAPPAPDASAAPDPTTLAAHDAQAATPGTNPVTSRVARPISIPGVPGLGVPGVSARPRSAEDLIRTMISTELAKPYTLKDDEQRMIGDRTIAKGGGKKVVVPAGGTLVDENNPSQPLATGGPSNSEFGQFQQIYAEGLGATSFAKLTAPQKAGAIPAFTKMKQDPALAGMRLDAEQMRHAAADARTDQQQFNDDFRRYSGEVSQKQKAHAEAFKTWQKAADSSFNGTNTQTGQPLGDAPEYTPQTFEEWRAEHPAPAPEKKGAAKPAADAKAAAVPKDGTTGTIKGKPVVWKTIPGQGAGWMPAASPPQ